MRTTMRRYWYKADADIQVFKMFVFMQWLETRPNRQVCPVCKAGISRDKVIPLYGRGSTGQQDPRWVVLWHRSG